MKKLILISLVILPLNLYAADAAKGKEIFTQRCATCHGTEGAGDGPAGAALPPEMKPRNLQTGERKVATDDAKLKELITKGGPAFGLSPLMAPQSGLAAEDLDNLVAFVNSLKK